MDDAVIRSLLKWPDIPAVYGWLMLDRRGNWRIRNPSAATPVYETIGNAALRQFIGRNYAADARGCWFFQNGPQRVYVGLAYAPFVFRIEGRQLADQCGARLADIDAAWLDEEGSVVLKSGHCVGLLDDRDLAACAERLMEGHFDACGTRIPVATIQGRELESRFDFVRTPGP